MISERKMNFLLKVAEVKSISKAAKDLYVSQPALSQLIKNLEEEYGSKIFDYIGGALVPTFAGEMIIESFKKQKFIDSELRRVLEDERQSKTGRISVGISSGRAPMFLSIVLPEFQKKFPKVQVFINTQSYRGFESMVVSGALDLAFVMNKAVVPTEVIKLLVYEPLFDYYCLLACPPNHPAAECTKVQPDWRLRPPVSLSDFINETFIMTVLNDRHKMWQNSVFAPYNFDPDHKILISDEAAVFDLVQAGLGFALIQDYIAYSRKKGAFFMLDRDDSRATLCSIYRKDRHLTEAAKYFKFLVEEHTKNGDFSKFN